MYNNNTTTHTQYRHYHILHKTVDSAAAVHLDLPVSHDTVDKWLGHHHHDR